MPDLVFQDQSPHDLNLHIIQGPIDLRQFTELGVQVFCAPHFQFEARIIGQSHVLLFIIGDTFFYEVFACSKDVELGNSAKIVQCGPLRNVVPALRLEFVNLAEYVFESRIATLADGAKDVRSLEHQMVAVRDEEYLALSYQFPRKHGQRHQPKTLVFAWMNLKENRISVHTAHTYQEHAVFTETEVDLYSITAVDNPAK